MFFNPAGEIRKTVGEFFSFSQSFLNIGDKDSFVKNYDKKIYLIISNS
jgi:hypothetical protein